MAWLKEHFGPTRPARRPLKLDIPQDRRSERLIREISERLDHAEEELRRELSQQFDPPPNRGRA